MKTIPFTFILLLLLPNCCIAKSLNLCTVYDKMESEYEIKINLSAIKVRGNAEFKDTNLQQNIQNGECFGVSVPDDIEPKLVEFVFDIGIMPLQNNAFNSEKGQQSGKTTRDDDYIFEVPTDHDHENAMRSSRTVPITVYEAHKLNGKPIVINLGKIDPHGQFLNRRLFVETKNDLGRNYHALLYAIATKNGETEENKVFVGFAQLVRANGETSTSEQRQLTKYHLSIPIDHNRFFCQKISSLSLELFYYEKFIKNKNTLINNENTINSDAKEEAEDCPICLQLLDNEKMKLHDNYNKNSQHLFHKDCIIKWIESQQKIRCPLCNWEPTFLMNADIPAIFNGPDDFSSTLALNPLANLFAIANGPSEIDNFKRNQARNAIKHSKVLLLIMGKDLTDLILLEHFIDDVNALSIEHFFEIDADGLEEKPAVQQIRNKLKIVLRQPEISVDRKTSAQAIIQLIKVIRNVLYMLAHKDFEILQHISVKL